MNETVLQEACATREAYYVQLEKLTKRYSPEMFIPAVVSWMNETKKQRGGFVTAAGYIVAEIIEANCAYHRGHRNNRPEEREIVKIRAYMGNFSDVGQINALNNGMEELFFVAIARKQFYLQKDVRMPDFSRYYRMCVMSGQKEEMDRILSEKGLLSIDDFLWAAVAVISSLISPKATNGIIVADERYVLEEATAIIYKFIKETSETPRSIGERYIESRGRHHPILHDLIPSYFREKPGVMHPTQENVACYPFSSSVSRHLAIRNYTHLKGQQIFGDAFEEYVFFILKKWNLNRSVSRPDKEKANKGKSSCDFCVEFDDVIVLVEAKCISFSHELPTPANCKKDQSSFEISSAIEQLNSTAKRINSDKPIYGFIVTYDEIHMAGNDDYINKYIRVQKTTSGRDSLIDVGEKGMLSGKAMTITISGLEHFMCSVSRSDIKKVLEEYASGTYQFLGSFDDFLANKHPEWKEDVIEVGLDSDKAFEMALSRMKP